MSHGIRLLLFLSDNTGKFLQVVKHEALCAAFLVEAKRKVK